MRTVWFLTTLASFLLAGCGRDDNAPGQKNPSSPVVATVERSAVQEMSRLAVSITPDPPTADGCIKALLSGMHKADYRWEINGQEVPGSTSNLLCQGFRRGDRVQVVVNSGPETGSAGVTIANAPPRITEVAVNADAFGSHEDLVVKAAVIDVDDDPVELFYQWYVNGEPDPFLTGDTLPGNRYIRGDAIRFTIVASDGTAESKVYQSDSVTVANAPPQIVSEPPQKFEAFEYNYQVKASDADGDNLVWRLDKSPAGMSIDPAMGLISWPLAGVKSGDYPMKIVVSDPDGGEAYQEFTLTLGAPQ